MSTSCCCLSPREREQLFVAFLSVLLYYISAVVLQHKARGTLEEEEAERGWDRRWSWTYSPEGRTNMGRRNRDTTGSATLALASIVGRQADSAPIEVPSYYVQTPPMIVKKRFFPATSTTSSSGWSSRGSGSSSRRSRNSNNSSNRPAVAVAFLLCLASSCRAGWIDPDTRDEFKTIRSLHDGTEYHLVSAFFVLFC